MHIFLISSCKKKALSRTRAVLDSFAIRVGDRAWATPITLEGLDELRLAVRRKASRNTAVACYRNDGANRMRLLWIVGSKASFGPDGHYPSGYTQTPPAIPERWLRDVALLAQASGYLHDWGKSCTGFQDKLAHAVKGGEPAVEPVHHAWVSLCLFRAALDHGGFDSAWQGLKSAKVIRNVGDLETGIATKKAAAEFVIASHHKLFGDRDSHVVSEDGNVKGHIPSGGLHPVGGIDRALWDKAKRLYDRLSSGEEDSSYWRAVALAARVALILADHQVSSEDYQAKYSGDVELGPETLYANTKSAPSGGSRYDQPLDWHLRNVGETAGEIAFRMGATRFNSLSPMTIDAIMERASEARFEWQDKAAEFLSTLRVRSKLPALVFNTAGTGAGKTRANAKLACSLSDAPRFCIALNLRSLTLQTGDSLRRDLKLGRDEMSVVIGDRVVEKLHNASPDTFYRGDDDAEDGEVEIDLAGEFFELPNWLSRLGDKDGKLGCLVLSPVLVSTVDFIVKAGEPGERGGHALALLRVMHSDLILDEIDSYDPQSLIAVLRLVHVAAMFGRNVVCSSATISSPVAAAVFDVFSAGVRSYLSLNQREGQPVVVVVDDKLPPTQLPCETKGAFMSSLKARHKALSAALAAEPVYRMPCLLALEDRSEQGWLQAILGASRRFHESHRWGVAEGGVSFGLVRVANIKVALLVARFLSQEWPEAKVACYHANELIIHRHMKERRLDFLLSRKKGSEHILQDPEISRLLKAQSSIPFIVVATPVEEIGRDHDFDWAVVEPSSVHSIVQVSGRVNRHRLVPVSHPNVGILDLNYNAATGAALGKCFVRPGIETVDAGMKYRSMELSELLPPDLSRIDAALRLGNAPMAEDEDRILEKRLQAGVEIIVGDSEPDGWMCRGFYSKYQLRESQKSAYFRLVPDGDVVGVEMTAEAFVGGKSWKEPGKWVDRRCERVARCKNDWLSWSDADLLEACAATGVDPLKGMSVTINQYSHTTPRLVRDESFGFYLLH